MPDAGPIGGIYTAILNIPSENIYVMAGDLPRISPGLLLYTEGLVDENPGYDAYVPVNKGFYEPLLAVYSKRIMPFLAGRIDNGEFRITGMFENARIMRIEEDKWRRYDPEGLSFLNINRKEDVKKIDELHKESTV